MPPPDVDAVDRIISQWNAVRPDVDVSPIGVIGRVSRLSRLIDRRLAENFARFGIEDWMYDVLATLYRSGAPTSSRPVTSCARRWSRRVPSPTASIASSSGDSSNERGDGPPQGHRRA